MNMRAIFKNHNKSYMMVLVLSYLNVFRDYPGGVPISELARSFHNALARREEQGLTVDSPPTSVGTNWTSASISSVGALLLGNPLTALASVFKVDRERGLVSLRTEFREMAGPDWAAELEEAAAEALAEYWRALEVRTPGGTGNRGADLRAKVLDIMDNYVSSRTEAFKGHVMHAMMRETVQTIESLDFIPSHVTVRGSIGQGNWANVPWIALLDTRRTSSTRDGVYVCYLFSDDMSRCYLTVARGVTNTIEEKGRRQAYQIFRGENEKDRVEFVFDGMQIDDEIQLSASGLGRDYEASVIAYIEYEHDSLPSNEELISDLRTVMQNYQRYMNVKLLLEREGGEDDPYQPDSLMANPDDVKEFISQTGAYIASQGLYYSGELLANLLISLKVRPFVILAGVSGTGKSKIAALIARAFGSTPENNRFLMVPVRPDWSDPSELLGYRDLSGDFIPGPLTNFAERAQLDQSNPYFVVIDEMNLARVEYYLSDVLSVIETQRWEDGKITSDPLLQTAWMNERDRERYKKLTWPSNVVLIGTVNMDETTHSISKKVLDRATTIEFNHVDLARGLGDDNVVAVPPTRVIPELLSPEYLVLKDIAEEHRPSLASVVQNLTEVNQILQEIGSQVGYRVRDVISFFVTYSLRYSMFSQDDAFDIQLLQKVLPRIQGSSGTLRRVLMEVLQFCVGTGTNVADDPDSYQRWLPGKQSGARFPRSAAKTADMLRRLDEDGFTSYWVS
ncbi:DUF3578 domain-containing protein [Alicyclobacillus curvatus]|nr:DUF3578 domain-containing protein [Alicyclobacillus curvatus]